MKSACLRRHAYRYVVASTDRLKGPLKPQTIQEHQKSWLCWNPRAQGAAGLRKRPNVTKGWVWGALGFFWPFPSYNTKALRCWDICPLARKRYSWTQFFKSACGVEDPRHQLLQYFCDRGKKEYLITGKYNSFLSGQGRGGCQKLLLYHPPSAQSPAESSFLGKTRKKESLTHGHHWVLLLLDRRRERKYYHH